jgi:hypothetical protein
MLHTVPHIIIRQLFNADNRIVRTEYYDGHNWSLNRSDALRFKDRLAAAIHHDAPLFRDKLALLPCFPFIKHTRIVTRLINCPLPQRKEAAPVKSRIVGDFTISYDINHKLYTVGIVGSKLSQEYKFLQQQHKRVFFLHNDGKVRFYVTKTNGDKSGLFATQTEAEAAIALYYGFLADKDIQCESY